LAYISLLHGCYSISVTPIVMQRAFTVNHHRHLSAQCVRQKNLSFSHDNNLVTMLSSNSPTETVQLRINQTMNKRNNSSNTEALIALNA